MISKIKIKKLLINNIEKIKQYLKKYFIADDNENEIARKKHKRVGFLMVGILASLLSLLIIIGIKVDSKQEQISKKPKKAREFHDIKKLATGASNEEIWFEGAQKEILELKQKQHQTISEHNDLKKYLNKEIVNKEELAEILKQFELETEKKYLAILDSQIKDLKQKQLEQSSVGNSIEVSAPMAKVKKKTINNYVPAGSYVEASMISGVDAGVGVSAIEDPRQVLLRITGKLISAGFKKDYLTSESLMGCLVQCQAVGDLSSEKVYLKPVVMTCAKDAETIIELPVKGYVTASGKSGIRGEIVSREADLVAKSFFSGLVGGIGAGSTHYFQPNHNLAADNSGKSSEQIQNILGSGFGSGINQSSSRLSDYLIKRAEQYQPVISINEGTMVNLIFQEGFSLEEKIDEARNAKS
jgi:conjugal transfer pilus assembly protein TraB